MTELSANFAPDWVCPPGESVLEIAEERGWSQIELAKRLGYTQKHISQLINGKASITIDTAQRLELVLGSTLDFWLSLESNYQKHKARLEAELRYASWTTWLDDLPVRDLMKAGVIERLRYTEKNKPKIVMQMLNFFGVASPEEWSTNYGGMEAAFRRSREDQCNVAAIAAWLRLGEQKAEKSCPPKYNKKSFILALKKIRSLTLDPPETFIIKMEKLLYDSGVTLVLVPSIPRAHVSGVARWLSPSKPLIQLSLYGKTNDRFWFTFFHEAAHIILHADGKEEKKSVFLDDSSAKNTNSLEEEEADKWASNILIPESEESRLSGLLSKTAVIEFAEQIKIHPGIVVGRLQHDRIIEMSWMNDLKISYKFQTNQ